MRILELRSENFKRLSVVQITPDGNLIQITGGNGQGKTSLLDSIQAALGGTDSEPDMPISEGKKSSKITLKLGDGTVAKFLVTKTFTAAGSYLKLESADGAKYSSPQKMLNEMMGAIGYDPISFMHMKDDAKYKLLRSLVKIEADLPALDKERTAIYQERTGLNRDLASAKVRADAIFVPDDLPDDKPDVAEITARLTNASSHNLRVKRMIDAEDAAMTKLSDLRIEIFALEDRLKTARAAYDKADEYLEGVKAVEIPQEIDAIKVQQELQRANLIVEDFRRRDAKIAADAEVTTLERTAAEKTARIDEIDAAKIKALADAKMPVDGLSFHQPDPSKDDGVVYYRGKPLAQASGAEKLRVSAAIGAALNPQLRVLLCRDGSLLDSKSLAALGKFAEENDMQCWIEKVDETGNVGIVMEDGHVKGQEALVADLEKREAGEAETPPTEAAKPSNEPSEADNEKAVNYLAGVMATLRNVKTRAEADTENARVKTMLKRFPGLISSQWVPAYLARMKELKK